MTGATKSKAIAALSALLASAAVIVVIVSVVQGLGLADLVETNAFRSKVSIFLVLLAAGGAIAGFRCRRERMDYFLAAELYENKAILDGDDEVLHRVRQASWSHRAGRSSTYSSISLGLIIVLALLFVANEKDVDRQDVAALFVWVILISSVSVVLYGISLQLWDEALGEGYLTEQVILLRTHALVLSSMGWITLVSALGLAVIAVHSPLGAVVGVVGVVAGLYLFEHKWRLAHVRCDATVGTGFLAYLKRVGSGAPELGAVARAKGIGVAARDLSSRPPTDSSE